MDVAHTETLTETAHGGLYIIVALVFVAQAWQVRGRSDAAARELVAVAGLVDARSVADRRRCAGVAAVDGAVLGWPRAVTAPFPRWL